ncbi:HNH endonuclease signature motif containing protein [Streptomyces sp. ID05-26A]|nr:HNH endonuclease signature motif containing protein [Streptomyces sp. ID05-26A]
MKPRKPMKRTAMPRRTKPMRRGISQLRRTAVVKVRKASASTVVPKSIKDGVDERDAGRCQRCGRAIGSGPWSRHHRDPRGMGGSTLLHTLANVVLLCGSATTPRGCHHEVESQRKQAELDGWLVPMNIRAEDWPARRFGRDQYEQPGVEWTPAPPHPLQVDMGAAA